jgi:hypothetical protein
MNAFQFAKACEEYEIGLSVMFQAAQSQLINPFFISLSSFSISSANRSH